METIQISCDIRLQYSVNSMTYQKLCILHEDRFNFWVHAYKSLIQSYSMISCFSDNKGVDKGNFFGWRANPNFPTKMTSLKPVLSIQKIFLVLQHRPALKVCCKFAEKLQIYCKYSDKPNFWGYGTSSPHTTYGYAPG